MAAKSLLVIDDEPNLCIIIKASLEKIAGWKVLTANSGSKGLLLAKTELPDAILLDVMMPDIYGLELFQELQSNSATRDIPVILLTAKVQKVDLKEFAQLNIAGVIHKPFDPLTLADQVAQVLRWE